jgi:hypothetical protein
VGRLLLVLVLVLMLVLVLVQYREVADLDSRLPPVSHRLLSLVCAEVRDATAHIMAMPVDARRELEHRRPTRGSSSTMTSSQQPSVGSWSDSGHDTGSGSVVRVSG